MRESQYQSNLIKHLKAIFPDCVVLKNDANYIQGFPDLLVLYKERWAALEVKASGSSWYQPNQDYYVDLLADMSFGAFISPDNETQVLQDLKRHFRLRR